MSACWFWWFRVLPAGVVVHQFACWWRWGWRRPWPAWSGAGGAYDFECATGLDQLTSDRGLLAAVLGLVGRVLLCPLLPWYLAARVTLGTVGPNH